MNDDEITFELLNAYVDGELDAADAARVAQAVADDPAVARQVSALSRLRLAVAGSGDLPERIKAPAESMFGGRLVAMAAAASLLLFVAGSALLMGRDGDAGWLARAWEIHHGWSKTAEPTVGNDPALLRVRFAEAVPDAYVPDLSAAQLFLVHAATMPFSGRDVALLVGYRGTRGCKISLIAFPSPDGLAGVLNAFRQGRQEGYVWRTGALGYAILSDGMDSSRFRLIAESVRDASRLHRPIDAKTRTALRQSRYATPPCVV
jgi:anti-sigma factor RsiW